jgi:hypothetical protein
MAGRPKSARGKKQIRRPPRLLAGKGTASTSGFASVDLKPISATFDYVLEQLDAIRPQAVDPKAVLRKAKRLQRLQLRLADECPQIWCIPFELKTPPA